MLGQVGLRKLIIVRTRILGVKNKFAYRPIFSRFVVREFYLFSILHYLKPNAQLCEGGNENMLEYLLIIVHLRKYSNIFSFPPSQSWTNRPKSIFAVFQICPSSAEKDTNTPDI